MRQLEFDADLFQTLKTKAKSASTYWGPYVESITNIITKDGLKGFGDNYYLTQAFGDALRYDAPRHRIRKLLKTPRLYKFVERCLVLAKHKKIRRDLYPQCEAIFSDKGFVNYLAYEGNMAQLDLGISRYVVIDDHKLPLRYFMFLIYLEMLLELLKAKGLNPEDALSGNYMDIGGGYGATVDGMYLYKKYKTLGESGNYLLDQFPVTFIANQYLKYRRNGKEDGSCKVIQNTETSHLSGMNIKLFFNSNSFQEMDAKQIHEYCAFMKENKAPESYLALYMYDSSRADNSPARALDIFNQYFSHSGDVSVAGFFKKRGAELPEAGVIKGSLYLYKL